MRGFEDEELGPEVDSVQRNNFMERKDRNKKRRERNRQSRGGDKRLLSIEDYDQDSYDNDSDASNYNDKSKSQLRDNKSKAPARIQSAVQGRNLGKNRRRDDYSSESEAPGQFDTIESDEGFQERMRRKNKTADMKKRPRLED